MAGANNASGAANGDESMAHSVQERLEESGERARMKEWLYEALENGGWTAAMDKHAGQYVAGRMRNGGDKDVTPSVEQIADNIMGKGFDSVPANVRERLLKEMLAAVRKSTAATADDDKRGKGE